MITYSFGITAQKDRKLTAKYIVTTDIKKNGFDHVLFEALMHGVVEYPYDVYQKIDGNNIMVAFDNEGDATAFKLGNMQDKYREMLEKHGQNIIDPMKELIRGSFENKHYLDTNDRLFGSTKFFTAKDYPLIDPKS